MKKLQDLLQGGKSRQALRGGAYSLAVTAVVLAIVVVVNILASALPASLTRYDISSSKLYSITSNTKVVVNALEEDVTIAGEPVAILYAASDAKDTDWVVRVTDVDESGASIRMCDGLVRARFRKSFIEPKLLLPGEVVRYEIPLTWISARFRRGHRIRVEVTSGADNSVFPNPNTGRMMADETEWKLARQTVCSGGDTPSRVILPVL